MWTLLNKQLTFAIFVFNIADAVVELQAIKAELKRKDEQREELLLKLKVC